MYPYVDIKKILPFLSFMEYVYSFISRQFYANFKSLIHTKFRQIEPPNTHFILG